MSPASILTRHNVTDANRADAGGKGENLYRLAAGGLPVPPWFVVPVAAFADFLAHHQLRERLATMLQEIDFQRPASVRETSERIRTMIERKDVPEPWRTQILKHYIDELALRDGDPYVAVRSSAVGEDSASHSFAGQLDSFLYVRGDAPLLQAVKGCWASAFSERGLAYRHHHQLPLQDVAVAVIVQEMVPSEVSGVMFTANPMTGSRDEIVINAVYGLGEGLVSGLLDADSYAVARGGGDVQEEIVEKAARVDFDQSRGGGSTELPVPEALRGEPSLTREQAVALAGLGEQIEALYAGAPQDIEWGLARDKLYILQARPITNLPAAQGAGAAPKGRMTIWDNSNITESYSGVTSPLTFTFARQAYTIVYHQFCDVMGVPQDVIQANNQTFRNMLGLLRGRIYYNLQNWYKLLSLFPGFNYNKAYMEQMMGLKDVMTYEKAPPPVSAREKYMVELPKLLGLVRRMSRNFRNIDHHVDWFQANFNEAFGKYKDLDFRNTPPEDIVAAYYDLERRLLWNWKAPIMTDFFAMIFYGVLKKLVVSWCGDTSGSLQNNLLCGQGNIESTEPTKAIMRMAAEARQDPKLAEFLQATPPAEAWPALQQRPDLAAFRERIQDYLNRYGYRCMNELKLEEKNLKEDPSFIFAMLGNYLRTPKLDVASMEAQERQIRDKAEALVRERVRGPVRVPVFRWVLENARKHVRNRENMRFARTKIFGLLREMFQALGHHFHKMGTLDRPEDVFYLNLEEMFGFVEGTATCERLDELARLRRREFDKYRAEPADDRIVSYGAVYYRNVFVAPVTGGPGDGDLRGVPCCPGIVEGPVKAILSPNDDMRLDGEILVAERTDPGWVPLYPSASGLLIERGSILSHSAIVARELGLPTIVGIKGLTQRVKTGMTVKMDAGEGVVYLTPNT